MPIWQKDIYSLTPARHQKANRTCVLQEMEDLVNGGCNSDIPKVAKFLDI